MIKISQLHDPQKIPILSCAILCGLVISIATFLYDNKE